MNSGDPGKLSVRQAWLIKSWSSSHLLLLVPLRISGEFNLNDPQRAFEEKAPATLTVTKSCFQN